MVTFAFGWVVVIRYLTKLKRNSPAPLPGFVGSLLNSVGATILCLTPRPDPKSKLEKEGPEGAGEDGDVQELVDENKSMNQYQQDWEWLACLLDRIAFIAYFIVYLIFVGDFLWFHTCYNGTYIISSVHTLSWNKLNTLKPIYRFVFRIENLWFWSFLGYKCRCNWMHGALIKVVRRYLFSLRLIQCCNSCASAVTVGKAKCRSLLKATFYHQSFYLP